MLVLPFECNSVLKEMRLKLEYETRREPAEQLGVPRFCIEPCEYGRRPIPKYAEKLIRCLHVAKLAKNSWE
jgi:DNA-binding XRE family transcriptional regulator